MTKPLTAKAVESAKPDASKQRYIPDGGTGLYLQIMPSGIKSWAFRYRFGGKPRKLTLGKFPSLSLVKARDAARAAREAIDAGRDPGAEKQAAKRAPADDPERELFENMARDFIERHAKPNNRSWKQSAFMLGLRDDDGKLVPISGGPVERWGSRRIGEITKGDVRRFLDDMVARANDNGDRGTMANRTFAGVRKFFNWCVEKDLIPASPCSGLKPPVAETSRERILSENEILWLLKACDATGYPFGPLAKLLLLTLQRRNEVAGMTDSELDLDLRTWTIPGNRTKNKRAHIVHLSDAAANVIKSLVRIKSKAGYLFTMTGGTHVTGFSRAKAIIDRHMLEAARRYDPAAKIAPWTLHDLRRTGVTILNEKFGIAPHVIEAAVNHISGPAKSGVAGVYNRALYLEERKRALDAWASYIEGLTSEQPSNVVRLAG